MPDQTLAISRRGFGAVAGGAALAAATLPAAAPAGAQFLANSPPDAFTSLIEDHRRIVALFQQIQAVSATDTESRANLLLDLKLVLTAHALAEENVVYPALRQYTDLQDNSIELAAEHAEIKNFLFMLEQEPKNSPRWMETVNRFQAFVMEHVEDEEDQVFPAYRAKLDQNQMSELSMLVAREKALIDT